MFIPIIRHATIENKTIVYSDTILPVKDLGNNIKVTTISNVSENSLEKCIKTIFESNKDVTFNTIQYSKNNKKVYFYTDKEISTKTYEENKLTKYKPIDSKSEILEEIKRILQTEKNNNSDCISLYDVAEFLKKLNYHYDMIKKRYEPQFDNIIISLFGNSSRIVIYDFDYENKLLRIGFKQWSYDDYSKINFAKKNGDLYIAESETSDAGKIFNALSSDLSKMYDEYIKFTDYKDYNQSKYNTTSVNSNFNVTISRHGARIFTKSPKTASKDFELFSRSYNEKYLLKCNSEIVNETIKNNEDEIFKRIYVKIDNCPEWSQRMLYEIRQNQLLEEQKIEKEIEKKEENKQKILNLKRKLFPFLKK